MVLPVFRPRGSSWSSRVHSFRYESITHCALGFAPESVSATRDFRANFKSGSPLENQENKCNLFYAIVANSHWAGGVGPGSGYSVVSPGKLKVNLSFGSSGTCCFWLRDFPTGFGAQFTSLRGVREFVLDCSFCSKRVVIVLFCHAKQTSRQLAVLR